MLRYVLITPARNEEGYIEKTIESMVAQTVLPDRWLLIDDGSDDRTPKIMQQAAQDYSWIEAMKMPAHRDRSFAAKATCFNEGYRRLGELDFDVIGNLDADISFEKDYLEFLLNQFVEDPALGVAGTTFQEEDGYDSGKDSFEGAVHVAGGCQVFRRECFEQVGGFVPNKAGGVDWIAVTTARMLGWKTRSFKEKSFFHHRSLGTAERRRLPALFSYGEKDYYLGNHPVWELFRVLYRMGKRPFITGGLALSAGYLAAAARRIDRPVCKDLMKFHRAEQLRKLRAIFASLLRFRRVDNFELMTKKK